MWGRTLASLVVLAGCGARPGDDRRAAADDATTITDAVVPPFDAVAASDAVAAGDVVAPSDGAVAVNATSYAPGAPAPPCGDDDPLAAAIASTQDRLTLHPATFADLPGWTDDRHAEAVPAFLASCARLAELGDDDPISVAPYGGRARAWRKPCAAASRLPPGDHAAARAFFEAEFAPYAAHGGAGPDGKMTGYYVESLRGSRRRHGRYQYPVYARPPDLVSVDLTRFVPDARGRRIWGRLDARTGALVPYPTRGEIRRGALAGQGLELVWTDDPIDALFLEIQGSGRMLLDDGSEIWLEFAGKNGRPYRGVGKVLRDLGELQQGQGTMQGIRAWLEAHPDRFDEIADQNQAKVFFAVSKHGGGVGSQGVVLTPGRSLAIDRAYVAHSTPIWVDTRAPATPGGAAAAWRRLLVAQDTGGGILGPVRGDIYFGADDAAGAIAGRTGGPGRYWLLLPRSVQVPSPARTPSP
ncbi:MAG TPA: murein transglycosylase A [Kofleriaceae bacterium]|nr:murein transglycosylase A [Kofleriaceae bacterium]